MRCCFPSCAAPRKLEAKAKNKDKIAAGGGRFIAPYLRTHTRALEGNFEACRTGEDPGEMRLFHISPAGENDNLAALTVFPAEGAGPVPELNSPETCP